MSKKSKIKQMLKPLIRECIREILMEKGLASIVTESQGLSAPQGRNTQNKATTSRVLKERKRRFVNERSSNPVIEQMRQDIKKNLGGANFDPFKGTTPLKKDGPSSPIEDMETLYESQSSTGFDEGEEQTAATAGLDLNQFTGGIQRSWGEIFERTGERGE
jgi:hypothetical protein